MHAKSLWMLIFLVHSDFEELKCQVQPLEAVLRQQPSKLPPEAVAVRIFLPTKEVGPKSAEAPVLAAIIFKQYIIVQFFHVFSTVPSATLGDRQTPSYSEPASVKHELCSIQADELNGTASVPINAQIRFTCHAKLQDTAAV